MKSHLETLLDQYFDEHNGRSLPSPLTKAGSGDAGRATSDPVLLRMMAQIGIALKQLSKEQRDALYLRWVFDREFHWWSALAKNQADPRRHPTGLMRAAAMNLTKGEISTTAAYYRREWKKIDRKPLTRNAFDRFARCYRRARRGGYVGLASDGLR